MSRSEQQKVISGMQREVEKAQADSTAAKTAHTKSLNQVEQLHQRVYSDKRKG